MELTYKPAAAEDMEPVFALCKNLIEQYENLEHIDLPKVLRWVRRKIETCIGEYTVIYAENQKAGYYHFCKNEDGLYEIDDLYIFPEFQNRGIGTAVIKRCCASVQVPVVLYVFVRNTGAVALYERLGFKVVETVHGSRCIMRRENDQK